MSAREPLSRQLMRVLVPEWRREWIADDQPHHDCLTEAVWLDEYDRACGVCGVEVRP